ncbi:MAG: hypothetical protein JWN25_3581 [Verrucomicrobiales bacterium]|nr:hypothetical protein [Verrucomicrobiales bacterium]
MVGTARWNAQISMYRGSVCLHIATKMWVLIIISASHETKFVPQTPTQSLAWTIIRAPLKAGTGPLFAGNLTSKLCVQVFAPPSPQDTWETVPLKDIT